MAGIGSAAQINVQRQRYWTAGFNLGMFGWAPVTQTNISGDAFQRTYNFGFSNSIDANGNKNLIIAANTSYGLNTGFLWRDKKKNSYTALQIELQNNKACYEFNGPFDYTWHGQTLHTWVSADKYLKYSLAIQRCWYKRGNNLPGIFSSFGRLINSYRKIANKPESGSSFTGGSAYWYLRASFGQTFLHRNLGNQGPIKLNDQQDYTENGTGVKFNTVSFHSGSWMLGVEIGIRRFTANNKHALDIGLVYYAPFSNTCTSQYEFFQNNVSVGKGLITANGGALMLNLRYTVNHKLKDKPIDTTIIKNENHLVHLRKINGRRVEIQNTIKVNADSITIMIWDKGKIDGDRISLYLNGDLILEDFTLSRDKKKISLHLLPGENFIVMHALNLGRVPPNTAAMKIDDGTAKGKNMTLVSDTKKSSGIEIIYMP